MGRRNASRDSIPLTLDAHVFRSEARRVALLQTTLHPNTLPAVLSRARDIDPINRKLLYSTCLAELPSMLVLSLEQRAFIVRHGCKDREDAVRKAARALIAKWAGELDGGLVEVGPVEPENPVSAGTILLTLQTSADSSTLSTIVYELFRRRRSDQDRGRRCQRGYRAAPRSGWSPRVPR